MVTTGHLIFPLTIPFVSQLKSDARNDKGYDFKVKGFEK